MAKSFTRRALLGATALGLAATAGVAAGATAEDRSRTEGVSGDRSGQPEAMAPQRDQRMLELEEGYDARLGVYAFNTGTGAVLAHRPDERFAFCSVFKALVTAAVLHHNPMSRLDELIRYTEDDLMASSFVTREHVDTGMTIGQLSDAAVRFSDGTAGNLLLKDLGGPDRLTDYTRLLGDRVTRMDRYEPDIVTAIPGDPRDTSSPLSLAKDLDTLVLGRALSRGKRAFLRDLLERNTTGSARVKAALPPRWRIGNKTGTGDYGTLNDIAVVWPPDAAPLVLAIMSSKETHDAEGVETVIAEAAEHVFATIA
ncbi:class A beta-lactamase [Stackebrandtia soli]|uniref:class A beta-lactamase n=1 Tax=Stackebrandtia soli TaxID=1892856 RepID=UPI0039EAC2C1